MSSGRPEASDAAAIEVSPFCVPTQTSTLSSVTSGRRGLRFHRGVIEEGCVVLGFEHLRCAGEGLTDIAIAAGDGGLGGLESGVDELRDRVVRHVAVAGVVPLDGQCQDRLLRAPPVVGDDGDPVLAGDDGLHAATAQHGIAIGAHEASAEHRALHDRRVEHPGETHVGRVDLRAVRLRGDVEARGRCPDEGPLGRRLQLRRLRHFELRGCAGEFTVARVASGLRVAHDAELRVEFGDGHVPLRGRGGHQHLARGRTGLAEVVLRIADRAAPARRHLPVDAVATQVVVHARVLGPHLVPVALEFLGDEHREAGEAALPQFGARDADDHGVVREDLHPLREFGLDGVGREREAGHVHADDQAAAERGGFHEEGPAGFVPGDVRGSGHVSALPSRSRRHCGSRRGCAGRCRSGTGCSSPHRSRRRSDASVVRAAPRPP